MAHTQRESDCSCLRPRADDQRLGSEQMVHLPHAPLHSFRPFHCSYPGLSCLYGSSASTLHSRRTTALQCTSVRQSQANRGASRLVGLRSAQTEWPIQSQSQRPARRRRQYDTTPAISPAPHRRLHSRRRRIYRRTPRGRRSAPAPRRKSHPDRLFASTAFTYFLCAIDRQ